MSDTKDLDLDSIIGRLLEGNELSKIRASFISFLIC